MNWQKLLTGTANNKGDMNRRNKTCRKNNRTGKILNSVLDFTVQLRLIKKRMEEITFVK